MAFELRPEGSGGKESEPGRISVDLEAKPVVFEPTLVAFVGLFVGPEAMESVVEQILVVFEAIPVASVYLTSHPMDVHLKHFLDQNSDHY